MLKNLKIGTKITLLVVLIVLISVVSISYIAFRQSKNSIEEKELDAIIVLANLKAQKIEAYLDRIKSNLIFGTQLLTVRKQLEKEDNLKNTQIIEVADSLIEKTQNDSIKTNQPNEDVKKEANNTNPKEEKDLQFLLNTIQDIYQINHIYLVNREGTIIYRTGQQGGTNQPIGRKFKYPDNLDKDLEVRTDSIYFSNVYHEKNKKINASEQDYFLLAIAPVFETGTKNPMGLLIYELKMTYINTLLDDTTGLGKTGEIMLVQNQNQEIRYLNELRYRPNSTLTKHQVTNVQQAQDFVTKAATGQEGYSFNELDYRDVPVLAAWRPVGEINWGLIVKINLEEVYQPTNRLATFFLISSLVVFAIALVIGVMFSRVLINPLLYLRNTVNLLAKGVLPQKTEQTSADEIGEMTNQLNQLVENLRKTASFAQRIGEGDLEAEFKPISDQDTLGISLLTMRDSIQQSASRDEERNWIVTGLAEIGDILRSTSDINTLGEMVLEYVTKRINAVQGAFYSISSIDEEENAYLEMNASYAYNKKKYLHARFRIGEGLVGQAAVEQDTIIRTEIPDDYATITSGLLGDQKPKSIIITPLITEDQQKRKVYGALEFASFNTFVHREIKFVEEISEIIARTVFNIKVNENTKKLLSASEIMRNDLEMQQLVLRQNAEVMENAQDELARKNEELEFQIGEVQKANDKTRLLLENASEVITIYKEDKTISYISPSVEKILGYSQEEMIGMSDIIFIDEGKEAFRDMFQNLILRPNQKNTIQFSYKRKNGDKIWLEATGTNLLTDPAIQGIVVNTRDITERRRAEEEERKRGQMQALSENSPDLITRISKDGTIFYVNPMIESYTGHKKEEYLQKPLKNIDISPKIIDTWDTIVHEVLSEDKKISKEVDFDSLMGERVMQINAIPEYNDQNVLDSVLVVSHDITERKTIELEIQQKNKKITESINYARRIQEAIIPDTQYIQKFLPDSFVLYKPRDVVSGDFPWFFEKNGSIYIAAVDCTGHGVPGALISLIGYFLLNNIVNNAQAEHPSVILDMLDQQVTKTLKQDEGNSNTRDGMDIAMCKIDLKNSVVEYAGAHRPLFYITDGKMNEIKGDKYPIGGGQYKNRDHFKNTVLPFKQGDSFYIFSDGYPDQFGGNSNRKFSPRQIRELLLQHHNQPMNQVHDFMNDAFEQWRGEGKQTDDVLMIGMKF